MRRVTRRAVPVLVLIAVAACSRAGQPGRRRGDAAFDVEDRRITARAVAEYRQRQRPSADVQARDRLARVVRALIAAAEAGSAGDRAKQVPWEITLVESPNATVAMFSNGTIFVDSGVLRRLPESDDALAGVIGHAVARTLLAHESELATRRIVGREMLAHYGMSSGSSRSDVSARQTGEADYVGLQLAVDAGYDPDRTILLFDQLGLRDRGRAAREHLPALRARYAASRTQPQ